jgi:Family of unknown function (DUF6516)
METKEIEAIIAEFADLIKDHSISKDNKKDGRERTALRMILKDNSILEAFWVVIKGKLKHRYSFQWMRADNTLIIRWDNAPKHLDVSENHQHIGSDENVQPSEEMNLRKVLLFLGKTIVFFLVLGYTLLYFLAPKASVKAEKAKIEVKKIEKRSKK